LKPESNNRVHLFHFNDFHRRLTPLQDGSGGADRLVGKIRELEAENPGSITVNVGDVAGDNTAQGPDHFQPIPELFNQADVDILALGNHEFEDPEGGYKNLNDGLIKPFRGDVLVANVTHADGRPIKGTKPFVIRQLQEHSIAFIGVVTRELTSSVFPAAGAALTTMPIEETLRELIPQVRAAGAEAVVVLGHDNLTNMQQITKNVPGVDLALAAHDHRPTEEPIEVVREDGTRGWVAEADAYGRSVGEVDMLFNEQGFQSVEGRLHRVDQNAPSDPVAKGIMDAHEPGPKVKRPPKKQKYKNVSSFEELAKQFGRHEESKES
jgi:2',3'-cyclic-nucleotide 2'-phosphodiesterase (5'-nucleotidase family)